MIDKMRTVTSGYIISRCECNDIILSYLSCMLSWNPYCPEAWWTINTTRLNTTLTLKLSLSSKYRISPFKRRVLMATAVSLMVNLIFYYFLLFLFLTFPTRDCLISEKEAGLSSGLSCKQRSNTSQKWEGHK